jgi:hypothetical protein
VRTDQDKKNLELVIHWKGGAHTQLAMERPRSVTETATPTEALEIIRRMAVRHGDDQIASRPPDPSPRPRRPAHQRTRNAGRARLPRHSSPGGRLDAAGSNPRSAPAASAGCEPASRARLSRLPLRTAAGFKPFATSPLIAAAAARAPSLAKAAQGGRCPCRLSRAAAISRSISASVRYSRGRFFDMTVTFADVGASNTLG